jgi:hypothetical protein
LFVYREVADAAERAKILKLLESYLVRRNICRLTTKNYNKIFIAMIKKLAKQKDDEGKISYESIKEILSSFSEETNKFPNDSDLKLAFNDSALSNQNAREILYLIALYQKASPMADISKLSLSSYSVEHMMPVKWEQNWPISNMDEQKKAVRDKTLKTLGNLTLVTKRLNSKLSNDPWTEKKKTLRKYSSLNITTDYLDDDWEETHITSRAEDLAGLAIKMWEHL